MATKTLITPEEVKELAKIDRHIQPCDLNDIQQVEATMADTCLGEDFYNALLSDLHDYSDRPQWTNTETKQGEVKYYKGVYYTALKDTTAEPSLKSDWAKAPKFENDCYNDLWCKRLGRYIALLVAQSSLPILSTAIGASGTVKKKGEGFEAADETSVLRLQSWLASQVLGAYRNLHSYLTNNADSKDGNGNKCFGLYKGNVAGSCQRTVGNGIGLTDAHFTAGGGIYFEGGNLKCCETKSCSCPKCTEMHRTQTNRYVIA